MKRLYQLLAAMVVAILIPIATSAPASAAPTCEVGFTGPDSKNMCTSVEAYTCTVSNENSVTIKNSSGQTAASGSVTVSENGTGGGAISGTANNNTSATFNVTITNGADEGEEGVCSVTVTVPATEPPTGTPTMVQPPAVQPSRVTATPAALPVTSGDSTLMVMGTIAAGTVIVAGLSVAAVLMHRRLNAS